MNALGTPTAEQVRAAIRNTNRREDAKKRITRIAESHFNLIRYRRRIERAERS